MEGEGLGITVKVAALEIPPPAPGLFTVILLLPVVTKSDAGMTAVSWVDETKVVVRLLPAQRTTEVGIKLSPFTVRVNWAELTRTADGERLLIEGMALPTTVNGTVFEVPPPGVGFTTVMFRVPVVVRSDAGMTAVSWVDETKVVVRLLPAQRTTEVGTKSPPLTVRVN